MWRDPKTTVAGLICLAAVGGLLGHLIDLPTCVTILGIAGGGVGILAKDTRK
jgi:hypothetical protein